ncbi:MAG: hypothetical protein HYY04_09220 [Chloroflexi bacterium]|nr:hypothetical protein [Chloroflexota bacterium]
MEVLLVLVVLVTVAGLFWWRRRERPEPSAAPLLTPRDQVPANPPTLADAAPGDVVSLWQEGEHIVESLMDCQEDVGGRATRWRWLFLDNGLIVELAPRGNILYDRPTVYAQGTSGYEALTADVGRSGALKIFEARVRAATISSNPVSVDLDGVRYQVVGTGIFLPSLWGTPLKQEVWRDLTDNPADNVYFHMRDAEGGPALGLWTSHILTLRGRALTDADVRAVYQRAEQ